MPDSNGPDSGLKSSGTRPILNSWKEISGYLQIDVRTCQRWEISFGLPIHRISGSSRSRVIAYPDELDHWRSRSFKPKSEENGPPQSAPITRSRKRKWAFFLIVPMSAILILGSVIGLDRNPEGFRILGSRLVITNRFGLRLWSFETSLPDLQQTSYFRDYFQAKKYVWTPEGEYPRFPMLIIRDLDGDGKKEILLAPQTAGGHANDTVILFDSRGRRLWAYQTGREVRVGGRVYPADFVINLMDVGDFNGDGRQEILIGAHCFSEAPTRIVLLDLKKNLLGEYWHFGQLADYTGAPVDKSGRRQIVLVGQNNEYGSPCLLVLDPLHMKGASPQSPASAFEGIERGTQLHYLRFPNTEIDLLLMPRGAFNAIRLQANGHFLLENPFFLRVDLDPALQSPQVIPTDTFILAFDKAYREKKIGHSFERQDFIAAYIRKITSFDGRSWVSHAAMSPH